MQLSKAPCITGSLTDLNRLKKNSGMTIEQIASASGVPKGTLNKLFSGQTKDPQLSTVLAVVRCMGYTLDDLSSDTVSGKTAFSSRLRQAREQAGLTQLELAEKLGITKSAVGNYENGVSSPKWDVLVQIFDVLHVEPNFLYQDSLAVDITEAVHLTPAQSALLASFDQLNEDGQQKAQDYIDDLVYSGRYKKRAAPCVAATTA